MNRKPDKRNLNTKIELANAFKELAKKKEMNKISITDLIKLCNVNRNTFYYHFEDIYELIIWMFNEEIKKIIDEADKTDARTFLNSIFTYVESNKHILNSAYNSFGIEQFRKLLYPYFYSILNKVILVETHNVSINEDFKNFVIVFYCDGISGSIVSYLRGESNINKCDLIDYILTLGESISKIVMSKNMK